MKYFALLFLVVILSCADQKQLTRHETREYVLSDSLNANTDPLIESEIRPYREKMNAGMNIVLAQTSSAMEKGLPESALGNFVSDVCLLIANQFYYPADGKPADFAFFNNGGLRKSLPKGPVTKGDVYELMPFENELVILTLDGSLVKKIFNFIASNGGGPVAGVRFEIRDKQAVNITIHGVPFDSTVSYKAVTSDYLANGGDRFSMLSAAGNRESIGMKVRDALIQYMYIQGKTEQMITPPLDGRIRDVN